MIGIVVWGVLAPPPISVTVEHYTTRRIELEDPDLRPPKPPKPSAAAQEAANALKSAVQTHASQLRQDLRTTIGPQTLLQPDLAIKLTKVEEIPLPKVQIWTPPKPVIKTIVAPKPTPPTTADVIPSVAKPSAEINLADVDISSSNLATQKLSVMPSTTSPLVVKQTLNSVRLTPSTTSQRTAEPTPTAVLSMSDIVSKDGPVILPPVNQVVKFNPQGSSNGSTGAEQAGQDKKSSANKSGDLAGNGNSKGDSNNHAGMDSGIPSDVQFSTTKISLPPNGHFSAVIVGQNLEDQFPELATEMAGRMSYTVYLHVGSAHNWIMRFSLPATTDAATASVTNRLDAPWPYTIIRPDLTADQVNADVLMVHGFVNPNGHFENLSMAFPKDCPQAPFILKSLAQWQFRPASQNGQLTRVEVLLIIPED